MFSDPLLANRKLTEDARGTRDSCNADTRVSEFSLRPESDDVIRMKIGEIIT